MYSNYQVIILFTGRKLVILVLLTQAALTVWSRYLTYTYIKSMVDTFLNLVHLHHHRCFDVLARLDKHSYQMTSA